MNGSLDTRGLRKPELSANSQMEEVDGLLLDPYQPIQSPDPNSIIERYTSPECSIEVAVRFALQAIHGGVNNAEGVMIANRLISRWGWDAFLDTAGAIQEAGNEQGSLYGAMVEVLYKLSNPHNLPDQQVEKLYKYAQNDLDWVLLKAYLHKRERLNDLKEFGVAFCHQLLYENDVPTYDEKRVKQVANNLLESHPGLRSKILNSISEQYKHDYGDNYNSNPGVSNALEYFRRLSIAELIATIPSVFLFNLISDLANESTLDEEYYDPVFNSEEERQALIWSVLYEDNKVIEMANDLVRYSPPAYMMAWSEMEHMIEHQHYLVLHRGGYNLAGVAARGAVEEGVDDYKYGYICNSKAVKVAQNTHLVYSPTGRLLEVCKTPERDGSLEIDPQEYCDFLMMKNDIYSPSGYSPEQSAIVVALIFKDRLPDLYDKLATMCYMEGFDLNEYYQKKVLPFYQQENGPTFENVAISSEEVVRSVYAKHLSDWTNRVREHVDKRFEELGEKLYLPEVLGDQELWTLMNIEYGIGNLTEKEVHDTVRQLNLRP